MKKYIYTVALCMGALSIASCDDYLTVSSPDQLTSDSFWRDQADAEAGMAAAYSQLEYYIDTWEFAEVKWPVEAYREDIIDIGNDAMNYQNWVELYNFSYTNGNSQLSAYWKNNYRGISYANQVMEKVAGIENMDATVRNQMVCEAQFLRAYYHLKLLLNWEKIVIRNKYITDPADLDKSLSSRAECWDFIIDDLKTAAAGLPQSYDSDNLGRATSGAAYSYLGFAYLTRAYEESAQKSEYLNNALSAFNNVKGYALESNFASMFDGTNKNCKESIFELQTSMSSANGANYRTQLQYWIATEELGGWDEILPNKMLVDEYKKEGEIATTGRYDSRFYYTLFTDCDYYNDGTGKVLGYDYKDLFSKDRPAFRKLL
ncbi:MAG: RagB/SusD family nutrient uptake outer membrane protein, partial [Bacteroidales bacterium]|nr:RagB/SusD family nutrient uptake outer membrane protein [Bacteroidales bacterium]